MDVHIINNRIDGLRITIYDVLHYLEAGRTPDEIEAILPLSLEQVKGTIRYIEENRDGVLAAHREIEARIARGNPPEVAAHAMAGRARMEALRHEKDNLPGTERLRLP